MANRRTSIIILFFLDLCAAFGAVILAKYLQHLLPQLSLPDELIYLKAAVFAVITVFCYYFQDLYDRMYWRRLSELVSSILLGGGATLIALALAFFIVPSIGLERDLLVMSMAMSLGVAFVARLITISLRTNELAGTHVVVLGDGHNAQLLISDLLAAGHSVIFEGYIGKPEALDCPHLGETDELMRVVKQIQPDTLVVALDDRRGSLPIDDLLRIKLTACDVTDAANFYEDFMGKIMIEEIRPSGMIFTHGFVSSKLQDSMKRMFDVFFAALGLVLASPIMILTVIAIKLDSPGPILYLQDRVGKHGKEFKVYKFRSMRQDAEKSGPQWAALDDPRITRVGRIIRKLRIDELPQFINMLKNEMSFVGPRPERRYFIDQLQQVIPFYAMRLYVKPGVTGWAQINYPYGDSIEDAKEKLKYELYYMKHRSLWLDMSIIFQTIKVALKARGSQ